MGGKLDNKTCYGIATIATIATGREGGKLAVDVNNVKKDIRATHELSFILSVVYSSHLSHFGASSTVKIES